MKSRLSLVYAALAIAAAVASPVVTAQGKPGKADNPRIGTWTLNLAKSRFQSGPPPKSETRTYTVWKDTGVTLLAELVTASGEKQVTRYNVKYDGKTYPYIGSLGDKITVTGDDGYALDSVITNGGKVAQTTHSVISKDGRTLTMTSTLAGKKPDTRVYQKE